MNFFQLSGKGFHLEMGGRHIVFPDVSRSPPEIYLTRGYSAHVLFPLFHESVN